jgi:two-component system, OmpR family, KDP operon response regulator KdpE
MTENKRVLIVDDDLAIAKFVRANLKVEGFRTTTVFDGETALEAAELEMPHLVILDITLPGIDGFEVCRRIRSWSAVPIIMLSARGGEADKVKCLDMGADDYITKPFAASELMARIRAVLRRSRGGNAESTAPNFEDGPLQINLARREVTLEGNPVKVTPTEFDLLKELVSHAGMVLTHEQLLQRVWGGEYGREKEYLHVFVGRLRGKIEPKSDAPRYIQTVPRVGYRFTAAAECRR